MERKYVMWYMLCLVGDISITSNLLNIQRDKQYQRHGFNINGIISIIYNEGCKLQSTKSKNTFAR